MRIGINVPNELVQRVKQVNAELNLSQLCRAALEEYATRSERAREYSFRNHEEMEEIARRLIESAAQPLVAPDWVGYGLQDAREWVRSVDIKEWERFFELYDFFLKRDGEEEAKSFVDHAKRSDGVKGFHDRWNDHRELFEMLLDHDIDVPRQEYEKAYYDAWLSYALEARKTYLTAVESERKQVAIERENARTEIEVERPFQAYCQP